MASANAMYVKLQKLTNQANKDEMQFNKQEAATARAWQTEMSNTSHQREVKDLQAAGLNPVLASNQGAQSYTTSSASANLDSAAQPVANAYGAVTSASATRYAANQSYAASLAMANANIEAARLSKEASIESAKWNYKTQMDKPQSSPFGSFDRLLTKLSNSSASGKIFNQLSKNTTKGRVIGVNSVRKMSASYKSGIDRLLTTLNIPKTDYFRAVCYNYISNQGSKVGNKYFDILKSVYKR